MKNISKEDFIRVYNQFPPNGFIKFIFKYFSKETLHKDKWLNRSIIWTLSLLFFMGFISRVLNLGDNFVKVVTIIFSAFISLIVIPLFIAVFMNNCRINKIK